MNIEQQIYNALLNNAGGNQSKIVGIAKPTLIKMKRGENKTTFSQVFEHLFNNGITELTLKSDHTEMKFTTSPDKELTVTTKSLSK